MARRRTKVVALVGLATLALLFSAPAEADNCAKAEEFYLSAQKLPTHAENLLEKAILECPDYAEALNNLGVIRENQGRLSDALILYRRAIKASPDVPAPYAGLGDVLVLQKNYVGAAEAYQSFLDKLQDEKLKASPSTIIGHEKDYQQRLQKILSHLNPGELPGQKFVSANIIAQSLTVKPKKPLFRGLGLAARTEPSINIEILFEFNSDGIKKDSFDQIAEIAKALKSKKLQHALIMIEGHTDDTGSDAYNLSLSHRRARAVQELLNSRFGIDESRSTAKGLGEKFPIASNRSDAGRALNRRVTFVNLSYP
jgi:outer membrane protein OmpA-like peptidoglycan-associated protein